jgi:hypothetical protein
MSRRPALAAFAGVFVVTMLGLRAVGATCPCFRAMSGVRSAAPTSLVGAAAALSGYEAAFWAAVACALAAAVVAGTGLTRTRS